jgi:pimeloyl-ACP methyl ester carboxylesterase
MKHVDAGVLSIAYKEEGDSKGSPILLLHGFPYDVHSYDDVTPLLLAEGCRVITPYLRGYGPTRFLSEDTLRSGQQAALAHDVLALMDALSIQNATLGGYDWGGRAACIVAALWPERVAGLVSCGGYNIQNISDSINPKPPENEFRFWYQYYFHSERGRIGLDHKRYEFCKFLWRLWSPNWQFDEATYQRTATSFNNPDFVEVVIHSYRHRFGLVPGDPTVENTEQQLVTQPRISVPTIALDGDGDGVVPPGGSKYHHQFFTDPYERRVISLVGHNLPQEAPNDFAEAVLSLIQ